MEPNHHRNIFHLTTQEANTIDPEKKRLERPFSDAADIFEAASFILTIYDAYEPDEMFSGDDHSMSARRRLAIDNKARYSHMATQILLVVEPHLPGDYLQSKLSNELESILDRK